MKNLSPVNAFLSYASEDWESYNLNQFVKELIENINDKLRHKSSRIFDVVTDKKRLQNHEKFWDRIKHEIDKCPIFLAVISPRYIMSPWCKKEYRYAKDNVGRKRIFSICVDKDKIPKSFKEQELGEDIFGRHYFHLPPPGDRIALSGSKDALMNDRYFVYEEQFDRFSAEISEFIIQQYSRKRGDVVKLGTALLTGVGLAVGGGELLRKTSLRSKSNSAVSVPRVPKVRWSMGDSFSGDFSSGKRNGTSEYGSSYICRLVDQMTDGQFEIMVEKNFPQNKLFDSVDKGDMQCFYTAAYYHASDDSGDDRFSSLIFATSVPFGLNSQQQLSWLNQPDESVTEIQNIAGVPPTVMQSHYKNLNLNIIPFVAGGTGGQMGGWFKKPIPEHVENFVQYANEVFPKTGFRFRIAGLGGEIIKQNDDKITIDDKTKGKEIMNKLDNDELDAAEWIGPHEDMAIDLHNAREISFYYYPGWWDPGTTYELQVNREAWNSLPPAYQRVLKAACQQAYQQIMSNYDRKNAEMLSILKSKYRERIQVVRFPPRLMNSMRLEAKRVMDQKFLNHSNSDARGLYEEWKSFKERIEAWHKLIYLS